MICWPGSTTVRSAVLVSRQTMLGPELGTENAASIRRMAAACSETDVRSAVMAVAAGGEVAVAPLTAPAIPAVAMAAAATQTGRYLLMRAPDGSQLPSVATTLPQ